MAYLGSISFLLLSTKTRVLMKLEEKHPKKLGDLTMQCNIHSSLQGRSMKTTIYVPDDKILSLQSGCWFSTSEEVPL